MAKSALPTRARQAPCSSSSFPLPWSSSHDDAGADRSTGGCDANGRTGRGYAYSNCCPSNADTVTLANVSGDWYAGSVGVGPDALPRSLLAVVAEGGAGHQRVEVDDEPYLAFGVAIPAAETRYFELVPLADIEIALERLARGLVGAASSRAVLPAYVHRLHDPAAVRSAAGGSGLPAP